MGHLPRVSGCTTTEKALTQVARAEWPRLLGALRRRPRSLPEALHVALAPRVHHAMWTTFSAIARDFQLWVVAGSALLPRNRLGENTPDFQPAGARTYNTSYTFAPDGRCVAATRKVNLVPTQEDSIGLTPGLPEALPVVDTPFGRLGTLICYDGFARAHTADERGFTPTALLLDELAVDVIAQPSANAWPWEGPWAFNGPGETQLRSEQWFADGLYAQLKELRCVRYVVNPQLVGSLFDNTFEAPSLILERRGVGEVAVLARAVDVRAEEVLHVTVPLPGALQEPQRVGAGA
jgi:predicted amidohydrolase